MHLFLILIPILLVCLLIRRSITKTEKRLPPGPFRFPLIGNLVQMSTNKFKYPCEIFKNFSDIYGPFVFVKIGVENIVVIIGFDACRKIFKQDEWLEKTDDPTLLLRTYSKRQGIIFAHFNLWRATRRFTMRSLRDHGFGKKDNMVVFIVREIDEIRHNLNRIINENKGRFEPVHFFDVSALNIVWALVTGARFGHDDPKVQNLVHGIAEINHALSFGSGFLQAYPILRKLLPYSWSGLDVVKRATRNFQGHMEELIDSCREKGRFDTTPENFVEIFVRNIDLVKAGQMDDPDQIFTDENLVSILHDIFWAGSDTSSVTITYAILWLVLNRSAQERLHNELTRFILENHRLPTLDDKNLLPYTRASILEVARRSNIIPLTPRKVYRETPLDDYVVPADTTVLVSFYSVHMDEKFWGDPENFRPERFLDSNGHIIKENADHVMPFGLGKRNCMGETVAEATIYLFVTFLFSQYKFLPVSEDHKYETAPVPGVVMSPQPFAVRVEPVH